MRMNLTLLFLFGFLLAAARAQSGTAVEVMPGSQAERFISARSSQGAVQLTAGRSDLRLLLGPQRVEYGGLVWLHEPVSGLFLWNFRRDGVNPHPDSAGVFERFLRDASIEADGDSLTLFGLFGTTSLYVQTASEKFGDAAEGVRQALAALEGNLAGVADGSFEHAFQAVRLSGAISRDFFLRKFSSSAEVVAKIKSVARQDGGWRIKLEGEEGRAVVTLDSKLNLIEARKLAK